MADFNKSGTLPVTATFAADASIDNPLATHAWNVDGGVVEQTGSTFTRTFTSYKDYNITHAGTGTCGALPCTATKSISITAEPVIPGIGIPLEYVLGVAVGLGAIGLMWVSTIPKSK